LPFLLPYSGFFPVCTSFHVPFFSITFSIIKFPLPQKKIKNKELVTDINMLENMIADLL